jgi:prophage regulatory protein
MASDEVRILRLPEVSRLCGLGRSQIYALAKASKFPSPIRISDRCSGWLEHEVRQYIAERVAVSRKGPAERAL